MNEQGIGGWPSLGPQGGYQSQPPNQRQSKFSTAQAQGKPLPIPGKDYFTDTYGGLGGWIMNLLEQIFGPNWLQQWQNIIHNPNWTWPGWTPGTNGSYHLAWPPGADPMNQVFFSVHFVNGSWMFGVAMP